MKSQAQDILKDLKSRHRKTIHFSLLVCLFFIQLLIGGYFYNEMISDKKLAAITRKLSQIDELEKLTRASRDRLFAAQRNLQRYISTKDKNDLEQYFSNLDEIGKNLELLERNGHAYPRFRQALVIGDAEVVKSNSLKKIIDSARVSLPAATPQKRVHETAGLKKFEKGELSFKKYDIETKTYADTLKKKNIFKRIGDAIKGKENVQRVTTLTTVREGTTPNSVLLKKSVDSLLNVADTYYGKQIERVRTEIIQTQTDTEKNSQLPAIYENLLFYNNGLMDVYEQAVFSTKKDLQRDYDLHSSKARKYRIYMVSAAMVLMFIISVLILLLTRIAFGYEQKLNEAKRHIEQNLNFKNRILGMLSHELRSPLKMMDLFIGRVDKKVEGPQIKEYLKSMRFTNNSLLLQANQILEFTKDQHSQNKLLAVRFELKKEVDALLTAIEPYVASRHNRFDVVTDIAPETVVDADKAKLHQLFLNIIGNANKFTENGSITVHVHAAGVPEGTVKLTVEVRDTGTGISASDLEKIFEPYYQGIVSADVDNIGAGLGLSLCKDIVSLFNGDISVTSEKNIGTTVAFKIYLNKMEHERAG